MKHIKSRKKTKTKTTFRKRNNKTRRMTRRMRGGFIDDLKSVDFNPNLAYDAKQMGGIRQIGGQNIGAGCPDPNFSIYNTNELSLFPYRPT